MKYFLKTGILSLFFTTCLLANIVEHREFASIFNYIQPEDYHKNTIIILDIDSTIAIQGHPFQMFGGDMWVSYEINKLTKQGLTFKDALAQILPFYFEITHRVELKPVESTIPEIIKQLQNLGVVIIACTVRGIPISERTIAQLKTLNIDLGHSAFGYEPMFASDLSFCYKEGIIFCSNFCPKDGIDFTDGNKGNALKHILEHFGCRPTKVIVIDDREKYLHQIKNVLNSDIEFIGIRYSHLDEKVAQFDPIIAEQEKQVYLATL